MIFCQATNEKATRRNAKAMISTGPVPCRNAANFLLIHRDGTMVSACCGKHRRWIMDTWTPAGTALVRGDYLYRAAREAFYGLFR